MSYSNAKRRRIKPFARPTSFDINVQYDIRHYQQTKYGNVVDPYFPAVGTDEAFKVCEGEVLMQQKKPSVRRYGDHQMHVFSFANGLKDGRNRVRDNRVLNASAPAHQQPTKAGILAGLRYAGVAVTEFTPEKDVFEQGFVMTMGGLNTLFNNGNSTIYPGDLICADIPNPADAGVRKNRGLQTGVPHDKLQFIVTPFRLLSDETKEGVDPELASKFIMGTALSYSRPGNPVDVVLHKSRGFTYTTEERLNVDGLKNQIVKLKEERLNVDDLKNQIVLLTAELRATQGAAEPTEFDSDDDLQRKPTPTLAAAESTLAAAESKKPRVKAVKKKPDKN